MSYMTNIGMVIYDQHNFSTNFAELFMAIFNSLNCNAGIHAGQEWRKRKFIGGGGLDLYIEGELLFHHFLGG